MHPARAARLPAAAAPQRTAGQETEQERNMTQWQPQHQQRRPAGQQPATPPQWQQDAPPRDYQPPAGRPAASGHPNAIPRYDAPWNQPEQQEPREAGPAWTYRQPPRAPAQPQYAPQQPWQPQQQRHSPPPPQQPRKPVPAKGIAILGCSGLIAVIILIGALASSSPGSSSPPPAAGQQGAPAAQAAPAAATTVATFSGSGIQNTAAFTVTPTWRLDYSFDCSNFGQSGNFLILEDGSYGAMDVNELAFTKSGTSYAYNDAGKHYIEVDSECSWSVKVIDEGS